jgi:monothiol glutaredoxin
MLQDSVLATIDAIIKGNNVVLFMKGNQSFPQCGFSGKVVHILETLNIAFKDVNVLEDEQIRHRIKQYSDWPTIPQLYIDGKFIGGCDIVIELHQNGQLLELLKNYIL